MSKLWRTSGETTISDVAKWLGLDFWWEDPRDPGTPGEVSHADFLAWPPDVFAVMAVLLEQSGAYRRIVSPHRDNPELLSHQGDWLRQVEGTGRRWSNAIWISERFRIPEQLPERIPVPLPLKPDGSPATDQFFPKWSLVWDLRDPTEGRRVHRLICALWTRIWAAKATPIRELEHNDEVWPWVIRLFCMADAACEGVGRCDPETQLTVVTYAGLVWLNQQMCLAQDECESLRQELEEDDNCHGKDWISEFDRNSMPASLCRRIHPSKAIVLPKLRTPQRGIALRSLSLHLAFVAGADVVPQWTMAPKFFNDRVEEPSLKRPGSSGIPERSHNLLIVPHPHTIHPKQFRPLASVVSGTGNVMALEDRFGEGHHLFAYEPCEARGLKAHIEQLISRAEEVAGPVRGVVLPEAALDEDAFSSTFDGWKPNIDFLVSGVMRAPRKDRLARNYAVIRFFGEAPIECTQQKHHRWALDHGQIRNYGIGGQLSPEHTWWEGIHVPRRRLNVISMTQTCYFCALICEDLARPDPIGEVIRAIGPNLVIALLQDGPQLKERWAGRFTVPLADDPGSAVLSVTSLGMSRLSRPGHASKDRTNPTVALFREPGGAVKEIALPRDADAILLTLTESDSTELSADGRRDLTPGGELALGGVLPINPQHVCYNE